MQGEQTTLVCCVNVDPRGSVGAVHWLHNGTLNRSSSETPFSLGLGRDKDSLYERCWYLNLTAATRRDSGNWSCVVPSTTLPRPVVKTIPIIVRG